MDPSLTVNLDGAVTVGDVVDLIDLAATDAGVSITASLAETGNGIALADGTSGTENLAVTTLNLSMAAIDPGLVKTVTGEETVMTGGDPAEREPRGFSPR